MSAARLERSAEDEYAVTGDLTFATVGALHASGIDELGRGGTVTVHLEPVTRTDSAGLALLIDWTRQAHAAGGRVEFSGLPQQLSNLVRVCGLDDVLAVRESEPRDRPASGPAD